MGDAPGLEDEAAKADLDVLAQGERAERTVLEVLAQRPDHRAELALREAVARGAHLEGEVEGDRLVEQAAGLAQGADGWTASTAAI